MPGAKFRLQSVTIEGFKGFSSEQTIDFSGKHTFLFGKNGCGKSSVVEAVRWCLFGLADRPETEVRNAYYPPSECRVGLALQAGDGIWHVQRRLRPGAERSRLTITNPTGHEVLQSQVFPYLARIGPREGTHVIFAAQQSAGRRPQADISDFHKVLYLYLHLEEVPDLLERMDKLLEEQQSVREEAASEIDSIEEGLRERLQNVDLSLEELLRNPPWAEGAMPTHAETEAKVQSFTEEIRKLANGSAIPEASGWEALEHAEQWCQGLANSSREELEKRLKEQRGKATALDNLLQTIQEAEKSQLEAQESIGRLKKEMATACEGQSLEELGVKLELLRKQVKESNAKLAIAGEAYRYCKEYSPGKCPVCLAEYTADDLVKKVTISMEQATPDQEALAMELNSLQARHERASELNRQLNESTTMAQEAQKEHANSMSQIRSLLEISDNSPLSEEDARARLSEIETSVRSLENSLESAGSRYAEWGKRIEALRTELRFHKYRGEQQRYQTQLTIGLEPMRDQLREIVELENTVFDIKETLQQAFNEAIDRSLPHLNSMMTDVYRRLTGQISFEKMYIQRKNGYGGQALRVRVGSERIPGQLFDPQDVLNGQANSALRLVPYFVFSQFQAETLELDLLLIDDPSQSFDTSHIDFLLQELANAGSHAQLVIASHEAESFTPDIEKYFSKEEYEIIKFSLFEPQKGPSFDIQQ